MAPVIVPPRGISFPARLPIFSRPPIQRPVPAISAYPAQFHWIPRRGRPIADSGNRPFAGSERAVRPGRIPRAACVADSPNERRDTTFHSAGWAMNILEIISGDKRNGAILHCLMVSRELARRGNRVTVACLPDSWIAGELAHDAGSPDQPEVIHSDLHRWPPDELRRVVPFGDDLELAATEN